MTATAQQATDTLAPTMPGKGNLVVRPIYTYHKLNPSEQNLFDGSHSSFATHIDYGLTGDTSLMFHVNAEEQSEEGVSLTPFGAGDTKITFKWRFYQDDFGPVDTTRLALLSGIKAPTGASRFSTNKASPFIGISAMHIEKKHGVTGSVIFHATQGDLDNPVIAGEKQANHIAFNGAYLYRLAPEQYSQDFEAAWYAGIELNGDWESDGDMEILAAPILLYESPWWAFEITVGLPLYEDVVNRPETEFSLAIGTRFLF